MNEVKSIMRISPRFILISSLLVYLISNKMIALRFSGYFIIAELLSIVIKFLLGKTLTNSEFIYRPENAGNCHGCGVIETCSNKCINVSNHVGMPSGHSLSIAMATTFWCLSIWNNQEMSLINRISRIILLSLLGLSILLSRSFLIENCHTPLQISIGGLLGVLLGIGFYLLDRKIEK